MPVSNNPNQTHFKNRVGWISIASLHGAILAAALFLLAASGSGLAAEDARRTCGLGARAQTRPYLLLPDRAEGILPRRLSQTGAFKDTRRLVPDGALIPYDLNVAFWSDGADKSRWVAVPGGGRIRFAPTGEWAFPNGTVFVKHFDLATNEARPQARRRLETRLLVRDANGGVYGATYKWRADSSDADLLATNLTEAVLIQTATGTRTQLWYYPSRSDCLVCHTANAGGVLGVKTRQMNRDFTFPNGVTDNQLRAWNHAGLFESNLNEAELPAYPRLARADDATRSIEDRARSYLDANCAQCHRPQGTVASFDARYDTPPARQDLVEGQVLINEGVDGARLIAPNDIWRSLLFMRVNTLEAFKMPPLARNCLDERGIALLRQWIESLPGPPVLAPPAIAPRGGNYDQPVEIILKSEPGAHIHYTLDGSVPTTSDPVYTAPIRLTGPTILRAKSFKPGYTKSITAQEVFIIGS